MVGGSSGAASNEAARLPHVDRIEAPAARLRFTPEGVDQDLIDDNTRLRARLLATPPMLTAAEVSARAGARGRNPSFRPFSALPRKRFAAFVLRVGER